MKTLLLCFLAAGLTWLSGVRIHADVLKDYSEVFIQRDYRRAELRSGSAVVGEFVSETPQGVLLKTREGEVLFSATSILKTKQLDARETFEALRQGMLPDIPERGIVEYLPAENHLLPLIEKIQKMLPE